MSAYVIAHVTVTNPERYPEYTRLVPGTLEPYGGRFIVRGGAVERLEGDWRPQRLVVIEFPTVEQAKAWYHSSDYGPVRELRWQFSEGTLLLVEGVPTA